MSSQPNDLPEILAAIARQEAEEEATRKFLEQEAREKKEREEADAKLARDLATQSGASNSSSSSSFSSSTAQGSTPLKTSEKDKKTGSEATLSTDIDIDDIMARFEQLDRDTKLAQELATPKTSVHEAQTSQQTARELQRQFEDELLGNTLDQDLALAISLSPAPTLLPQFQLEKDRKQNSDAALAAALQSIEDEGAAGLSEEMAAIYQQVSIRWEGKTTDERKKIEENLKTILISPAVAGEQGTTDLTNAHKFTSTLIRAGIPVLTAIDDQFKLSSSELTPDQVQKEVLEFLEKLKKEGVDSRISIENIQKTFGHVRSNPAVEAGETQANAHHLLSRTWTLAKTMGRDGMTAVATLLSDNIGDGGSCIPGLIARLYSPYAKMLAINLGVEAAAPRSTDKASVKAG